MLNKLRWLSVLVLFSLFSGGLVFLLLSSVQSPQVDSFTVSDNKNKLNQQNTVLAQQVTSLTIKLAELQSHVLRLDALGERLAEEANIPNKEFNFQKQPPSGGPMMEASKLSNKSIELLVSDISALEDKLINEEKQLKMLESLLLGHHIENSSYLSGRPIQKGWLSSYYGVRKDPFSGRPAMHKGIDFAGKEGGNIIATASGVVTWSGERYGYGQLIELDHGKGFKTRYGHNKVLLVEIGQVVSKGQAIAKMGSSGRSTGPHVHYEILKNERQIDPIRYVYRKAKK